MAVTAVLKKSLEDEQLEHTQSLLNQRRRIFDELKDCDLKLGNAPTTADNSRWDKQLRLIKSWDVEIQRLYSKHLTVLHQETSSLMDLQMQNLGAEHRFEKGYKLTVKG